MHAGINVVEDDEHTVNVILVRYYPDEDNEIDKKDVEEIVQGLDEEAYLYNEN
jgi:hypothetical protein